MRRYFYTDTQATYQRSVVRVWRLFRGEFPVFIGYSFTNGDPEEGAHSIISRVERLKLDENFKIKNKNVEVKLL